MFTRVVSSVGGARITSSVRYVTEVPATIDTIHHVGDILFVEIFSGVCVCVRACVRAYVLNA